MAQGLHRARTEIHSTRGARCGGLVHLVRVEPVAVRQHECVRRFRGSEASIMSNPFFDHPILNSPYEYPRRHWQLDEDGQPTQKIVETRRGAKFITPIPKPKKRKAAAQTGFVFDEGEG